MDDKQRIKALEDGLLAIHEYVKAQQTLNMAIQKEIESIKLVVVASVMKPERMSQIIEEFNKKVS